MDMDKCIQVHKSTRVKGTKGTKWDTHSPALHHQAATEKQRGGPIGSGLAASIRAWSSLAELRPFGPDYRVTHFSQAPTTDRCCHWRRRPSALSLPSPSLFRHIPTTSSPGTKHQTKPGRNSHADRLNRCDKAQSHHANCTWPVLCRHPQHHDHHEHYPPITPAPDGRARPLAPPSM